MQTLAQEVEVSATPNHLNSPANPPTHSFSLNSLLLVTAQPVLHRLSAYGELPRQLIQIISRASVRLLDSDMLISQTPHNYERSEEIGRPSVALAHQEHAMSESILEMIHQEGLAPHYKPFMRTFARILFSLFLTPDQYDRACACIDSGNNLRFLMSDGGGPTLGSWRTVAQPEGDGFKLHIDKVWGMYANLDGMAIVAARTPGAFFPSAYLVWPEQYETLKRTACGDSFLDGVVQLGNVKGTVQVAQGDRLKVGGPAVLNKYLTTVRPFLVRALMAHVEWLAAQGRVELTAEEHAARDFIAAAARAKTQSGRYDSEDVQRVLALKFASNELLLHLVSRGAVKHFSDQRDLLAFTKMEGSSYRCYHELRASMRVSKAVAAPITHPTA
ncbi:hypothetical protein [Collimonas pratensis]|uniref:Acyl-CoA dehydrogenase, C-terminal domain protein n=1 Tax=Collimonas pratensis TaxID=279113 RepID=A0A127Q4L9_9BURK|nr:hypothetical protein [Collimonas pratensis]AMP04963.1 hypothetical protein CPter91_2611 [Collimonas pratensis]